MFRSAVTTLAVLLLGFATVSADEIKGTVKKVNQAGNSITLSVDGKDRVFKVSKDASFVTVENVKGKKGKTMENVTPIDGGLGGIKEGATATVLTDTVDNKETVTSVKIGSTDNGNTKKGKKGKKAKKAKTAQSK